MRAGDVAQLVKYLVTILRDLDLVPTSTKPGGLRP